MPWFGAVSLSSGSALCCLLQGEKVLYKPGKGAFFSSGLEDALLQRGITHLLLAGSTEVRRAPLLPSEVQKNCWMRPSALKHRKCDAAN